MFKYIKISLERRYGKKKLMEEVEKMVITTRDIKPKKEEKDEVKEESVQ